MQWENIKFLFPGLCSCLIHQSSHYYKAVTCQRCKCDMPDASVMPYMASHCIFTVTCQKPVWCARCQCDRPNVMCHISRARILSVLDTICIWNIFLTHDIWYATNLIVPTYFERSTVPFKIIIHTHLDASLRNCCATWMFRIENFPNIISKLCRNFIILLLSN